MQDFHAISGKDLHEVIEVMMDVEISPIPGEDMTTEVWVNDTKQAFQKADRGESPRIEFARSCLFRHGEGEGLG